MLKLTAPDSRFRDAYAKARRSRFAGQRKKYSDPNAFTGLGWAKDFVDHLENRLDDLLVGAPAKLRKEIAVIGNHPTFRQFADYCAHRPSKESGLRDKGLEALLTLVDDLFSYEALSEAKRHGARALIEHYRQRICPYCHMHHVNFHIDTSTSPGKLNFRPALDHFYPSSIYPYLGVSLYNLVPACEQCNSRVKSDKDPLALKLAHPFEQSPALRFSAGWKAARRLDSIAAPADFEFRFAGKSKAATAFADFFHLPARYEWYRPELFDLVRRYRGFMKLDKPLRDAIDPREYLLDFEPGNASARALGLLLNDAATSMIRQYGKKRRADVSA